MGGHRTAWRHHTSEPPKRLKHLAWGALVACAIGAAVFSAVGEDRTATVAISGMCAFLVAVTLVAILRRDVYGKAEVA